MFCDLGREALVTVEAAALHLLQLRIHGLLDEEVDLLPGRRGLGVDKARNGRCTGSTREEGGAVDAGDPDDASSSRQPWRLQGKAGVAQEDLDLRGDTMFYENHSIQIK